MTKIPYFHEVIVSSFECQQCNYKETDVKTATEIGEFCTTYEIYFDTKKYTKEIINENMNRRVVKSETAVLQIPEIDFEIQAKRAEINTIEGFLVCIYESQENGQNDRKKIQYDQYIKIQNFLEIIKKMINGEKDFTFKIFDIGGNSFIENPNAPKIDIYCQFKKRKRTIDENKKLGLNIEDDTIELVNDNNTTITTVSKEELIKEMLKEHSIRQDSINNTLTMKKLQEIKNDNKILSYNDIKKDIDTRIATFREKCHACNKTNETRAILLDIPYFNTVLLLCTDCAYCNAKYSEIKSGNGISDKGIRITQKVQNINDLTRDILKSDTCAIYIPELELELVHGTLGAKFTTLEGILQNIIEQLESIKPKYTGDSSSKEMNQLYDNHLNLLKNLLNVEESFTFILDDPSGNSFIEGRVDGTTNCDPNTDPNIIIENYQRTSTHDSILGIDTMCTENYD